MHRIAEAAHIATSFHNNAEQYDRHVLVQKRVVTQLAGSVELHRDHAPGHILDVGTGTGALLELLHARHPAARLAGVDIALNMCLKSQQKMGAVCSVVNGTAEALPFKSGIFDLVVSASVLQWVSDLPVVIGEMCRVAAPGGRLGVAFFCHGTLYELRRCFHDVTGGDSSKMSRLHGFYTLDDVTPIVNSMGFEKAVISVETEVDWYDDLHSLLRSVKNIGAGAVSGGSEYGLGWRGVLQETSCRYQQLYGQNGKIPATYKVLYLTATMSR
ncbi:MAG TPA: methyltransferase domain-containing protein [Desulfuromonadales bacterium]|nr:methyltransferase domain-containing protein [Desulfuromonadales bacterium]